MSARRTSRVLALWCPDWPAVAAAAAADLAPTRPVVVLHANRVVACSQLARSAGVRRGLRRREAQARCPDLYVAQDDPDRDARLFEPVATAVDATVPGVEVLRPGLLVLAARGAARFFGSEEQAAEQLVDAVAATGVECRIGIADEMSTAVLAARRAALVAPGTGAQFLASLPVSELAVEPSLAGPERVDLVDLLHRLGLRRIGDFAALTPAEVASRFGVDAIAAHRCARAEPERAPAARPPAPDLTVEYPCDPPIDRIDAAAFAGRLLAVRLHDRLADAAVACTRLAVTAETAAGERLSRIWRCAEPLTPEGTADRVRWQLDGWLTQRALRGHHPDHDEWTGIATIGGQAERPGASRTRRTAPPNGSADNTVAPGRAVPAAPIVLLRLEPVEVVTAGALQLGLWGGEGEQEERFRRALVRVQGLLGGEAVLKGVLSGGRGPAERITLIALGDELSPAADPALPWPGRLPIPAPAVVLVDRPEVILESAAGAPVWITDRGLFTADPAHLRWGTKDWQVAAWSGPWPLDERWWSDGHADAVRAQILLRDDVMVLLLFGRDHIWHAEGLYD
ncbi:DNA polymerase Y family protein [Nocardia jiangxiensis]|uniref:DNA polymerase Y family protein n=1 Tax=Nocardia jiangxiensis TaxID=282685 RepID=UPI003570A809